MKKDKAYEEAKSIYLLALRRKWKLLTNMNYENVGLITERIEAIIHEAKREAFQEAIEVIVQKTRPGTETICYEISSAFRRKEKAITISMVDLSKITDTINKDGYSCSPRSICCGSGLAYEQPETKLFVPILGFERNKYHIVLTSCCRKCNKSTYSQEERNEYIGKRLREKDEV